MSSFRPALAPPGRLARLGIVLDTRNALARLREIAGMADRAGLDGLWVDEAPACAGGQCRLEALAALASAASDVARARLGVMLDVSRRPPSVVATAVGTLAVALGGRLEIGFSGGRLESADATDRACRLTEYATAVRSLLSGDSFAATDSSDARDTGTGAVSPGAGGPPISIEVLGAPAAAHAVRVADNVVIPAAAVRDVRSAIAEVRKACTAAGRDPSGLGVSVVLPVSIGRTSAEARARADAEPLFQALGHPAEVGIFGTLEQCQDRVIELAHWGVTELRCVLPNSLDVPDVIAQLTAVVVGTHPLTPNAPRSRPPDPPAGWGGRSSRR
jgi:alkanesulfonate monooxygenase SsuD/methylene tetrahydromethanopterin reductase-like flavin-dependent oxidoreductase (luciferase family)